MKRKKADLNFKNIFLLLLCAYPDFPAHNSPWPQLSYHHFTHTLPVLCKAGFEADPCSSRSPDSSPVRSGAVLTYVPSPRTSLLLTHAAHFSPLQGREWAPLAPSPTSSCCVCHGASCGPGPRGDRSGTCREKKPVPKAVFLPGPQSLAGKP